MNLCLIKEKFEEINRAKKAAKEMEKQLENKRKVMILLYAPNHPNIGDAAIASAERNFLSFFFPEYYIYEVPHSVIGPFGRSALRVWAAHLKKYPLLIHGGGFLGTLWLETAERQLRRFITVLPRRTPLLILPQTIYYGSSRQDKEELSKAKALYAKHKNLLICTREKYSYEFGQKEFGNVRLIPDMALFPKADWPVTGGQKRSGAIICLRDDCEKTMSKEQRERIDEVLKTRFSSNIKAADMMHEKAISQDERESVIRRQMSIFGGAELVVTDRLHGMIFAAITETPCVVVASKSHKVKGPRKMKSSTF